MPLETLSLILTACVPAALALAPWMAMVHVRLAVLTAQMTSLETKVDKLLAAHEQQLPRCATNEARLSTLEAAVTT